MNWKVTALVSGLALMRPVVTFVLSESPEKKLTQPQEESPLLVGMVRFELTTNVPKTPMLPLNTTPRN